MIYLHKILPFFLSPIFIVLALAALGVITRRRRWVVGAMGLLYVASMPLVAELLFSRVEQGEMRVAPAELPNVDAVVVLSAGMSWVKTKAGYYPEWPSPSRFWGGIELLQLEKAPLLVFTGGKFPWQPGDETEGDVLKRHAELLQIPARVILVTAKSENTEQEAINTKKLLGAERNKIILVTSAFHMQRAQHLFERSGFVVYKYPVNIHVTGDRLTVMSFLPNPSSLRSTQIALNELLGRLYYRIKHG